MTDVEPLEAAFEKECRALAHLGPIEGSFALGAELLDEEIVAQQCGSLGHKAFVVGPEHSEVHIVVPGEYVLPEVHANGGSTEGYTLNPQHFAHPLNLFGYLEESLVKLCEYFRRIVHELKVES